ncbi:MAG: DUF2281 domain-containing protein [Methylomonas sp.]|nr:DUF2281 domain-containing protein [Methylomonas sp.]PPD20381.1 MAG: hypothetical protein CTY23_08885 [Methylomonas sp.]PPD25406.1 MAG: hypothetical protein CTY22_08800 [Methylomonas sp.]PPD35963.1 MAG: hypothetical protein CTY21_08800 [Methylomonas sp.]PPD40532.1 MAG: hypothetical protein CTY17_06000 [Methylomonas sp.]
MTIAEKLYEAVKDLPEQQAAEVLDFVEHLKTRQRCQTRQSLDDFFRPYQKDLGAFTFDRDDANAR